MVVWGLSNITDALQKRLCRFLIHRYLSDFLKSSINLEQLSATLYNGVASVRDVDMDVQKINEAFDSMKVPFTAIEGYIGEVNITVPWQYILVKSVDLEIKQLQLTLQLQQFVDEPSADIVTSMFGSVVGSLATSMQLAQNFLNQEETTTEAQDKGVEQFAEVIDVVISRFRLIFNDAIIRLESVPNRESALCTAIELRIDWIELVDEQLESEAFNSGTITSQPHLLSSVPDFNKLFHVKGIRLYTDIFTKPKMKDLSEDSMSASAQVITSMYLRREKEKTKKKVSASSTSSDEHHEKASGLCCSVQTTTTSTLYESCYSQSSYMDDELSSSNFFLSSSYNSTLESNPVLFASFSGNIETVIIRVRNNEISTQGVMSSEKEINLNFDGLCIFLTPSQLNILKTFFAAIARPSSNLEGVQFSMGKPMCMKDYQKVEAELQTKISPSNQGGTDFQHGNWGGSMMFYDAQRKPSLALSGEQMANVSLNLSDAGADIVNKVSRKISRNVCSSQNLRDADTLSDVTSVKATICNIIFVLTHKDYLGQDEVRDRAAENTYSIRDTINSYKELAENFFKEASPIRFGVHLNELRRSTKNLYCNDHLQFIGEGIIFDYSQVKSQNNNSFSFNLEALDAELLEILSPSSSSTGSEEHIKLLSLYDSGSATEKNYRLMVMMTSGKNSEHHSIAVSVLNCESELDISIIDRISSLLVTKPLYNYPLPSVMCNAEDVSQGLKTDFLFNAMLDTSTIPSTTLTFTFHCSEWDVNLRIPVTDLRHGESSADRPPHWKRNLRDEKLRLTLVDARLEVPKFDMSRLGQYGTVIFSASAINASFDLNEPPSPSGFDSLFLYAGCMETCGGGCVSLKLSYDNRNTSLKSNSGFCNTTDYACFSSYAVEDEGNGKVEGPFSKCIIRNEDRMVIMVGSTKEMLEFGENCISNASISCELTLPVLRVHLPSHHYYEVIYNRLGNDLAMWQPSSPVFSWCDRQRDLEASESGLFQLCKSASRKKTTDSADSESNVSCSGHSTLTINALSNERSHNFCLLANINDGRVLFGTEIGDENVIEVGSIGAILHRTQMLIVSGFHGNKELSYAYSTSKTAHLFHKNLTEDIKPYERCVLTKDFVEHLKEGVQAEPMTEEQICSAEEEDNFAIAVRIDFRFMENIKNIIVGVGIRNTTIHMRPYQRAEQYWINQIINFFDIVDYGIPGYELPQLTTEFHVHFSSSLLAYEHSLVNPSSPLSLRLVLGSCNVSSRIMQDLELYKFECIFEQLKLFASCYRDTEINKYSNEIKQVTNLEPKFIQLLLVGVLQLEVIAAKNVYSVDGESKHFPLLEIRCRNDLLKMWACSDSLCTVINAIAELLDAQTAKATNPNKKMHPSHTKSRMNDHRKQKSLRKRETNTERGGDGSFEHPTSSISSLGNFLDKSKLLSSAMKDLTDLSENRKHRHLSEVFGSDEGFCLIDEIPGSGITACDGKPRARFLFAEDIPPVICDNYLREIGEQSNEAFSLIVNKNHIPLFKYSIDDVSLEIHLYGGNDFGTSKPSSKPYCMPYGEKLRRDNSPVGGHFRDYSAQVELRLSKVKFVFEVYNEAAPAISTRLFSIGSVEILDRMLSSKINKLLYPHVCDQSFPRHSHSPLFSVRLYETPQHEGKMKVSLLPLRINADQDTLEFLENYVNDLSCGITVLRAENTAASELPTKPFLGVHSNESADNRRCSKDEFVNRKVESVVTRVKNGVFSNGCVEGELGKRNDEYLDSNQSSKVLCYNIDDDLPVNENSCTNSIISEELESASTLFDKNGSTTANVVDLLDDNFHLPSNDMSPYCCSDENSDNIHVNLTAISEELGSENNLSDSEAEEKEIEQEQEENTMETISHTAVSTGRGKIFFKEFTFSPSTVIRLDLTGKRMRPDQGWILGLLVGVSDFKCTEIRLEELNCNRGLLGFERCARFAINSWLNDINNRQLLQFIATYGPIKSLVEVGLGIRDLFLMPVNEYCREEGHVVKGLQKGAESFGISTATAAVDMLQKMVGVVQSVAELAFDIVSPEYPIYRRRRNMITYLMSRPPNDIRDGFNMALETLGKEICNTALDFQLAAQEDQAYGYSTVRGFLRQAPTTVIRPIVAVSRATAHILGGLRNQMKPDSYREEMEKWK